jgi:hypothetical protein
VLRRTSRRRDRVGRPAVSATLTRLLPTGLRQGYGYMRIQGELRCLAHRMATTTIRKIVRPNRITPGDADTRPGPHYHCLSQGQ